MQVAVEHFSALKKSALLECMVDARKDGVEQANLQKLKDHSELKGKVKESDGFWSQGALKHKAVGKAQTPSEQIVEDHGVEQAHPRFGLRRIPSDAVVAQPERHNHQGAESEAKSPAPNGSAQLVAVDLKGKPGSAQDQGKIEQCQAEVWQGLLLAHQHGAVGLEQGEE